MTDVLTIANVAIRQDAAGRFCLNDLHRAAGGEKRHQPSDWLRLQQTQELLTELDNSGDSRNYALSSEPGRYGGTFVGKELVYAYAMWVSPAFHLKVIRFYDTMVVGANPAPLSTMEILQIAMESEQRRLELEQQNKQIAVERDHAVATKALIGSKREATAMATASQAKREAAHLRDQLGFNARHATILVVEAATGREYNFVHLRRWCKEHGVAAETVPDKRYPNGVKAWPAAAWMAVYGVDLPELFDEKVLA